MRKFIFLCLLLISATPAYYPVHFFLDPTTPGIENAAEYLPGYVDDMNQFFDGTKVNLTYAGYTLTNVNPVTSVPASNGDLPQYDFELWAVSVQKSPSTNTLLKGWMDADISGAGVANGMRWAAIYNPDNPSNLMDYEIQIGITVHELAHVFWAGVPEYYAFRYATDTTGIYPILDVDWQNPNDPYWMDKQEIFNDPMFGSYSLNAEFAEITKNIINGENRSRPNLPYLDGFTVSGSMYLKVWSVTTCAYPTTTLLFDGWAEDKYFEWDGDYLNTCYNELRLIKAYKPGYTGVKWFGTLDSLIGEQVIDIPLTPYQSFTDVPTSHPKWQSVESIYSAGITGGCLANPLRFCPDNPLTRAQVAVLLLRANYGASYVPPTPVGIFADVPMNHWAARWIEQFYRDGITAGCGINPLRYCPDQNVTGQELNIFMSRYGGYFTGTPTRANMAEAIQRTFDLP